jgi:hypothetical protein
MKDFMDTVLCPMKPKDFNAGKACLKKNFTTPQQELCIELDCLYEAIKSLSFRFSEEACMVRPGPETPPTHVS